MGENIDIVLHLLGIWRPVFDQNQTPCSGMQSARYVPPSGRPNTGPHSPPPRRSSQVLIAEMITPHAGALWKQLSALNYNAKAAPSENAASRPVARLEYGDRAGDVGRVGARRDDLFLVNAERFDQNQVVAAGALAIVLKRCFDHGRETSLKAEVLVASSRGALDGFRLSLPKHRPQVQGWFDDADADMH